MQWSTEPSINRPDDHDARYFQVCENLAHKYIFILNNKSKEAFDFNRTKCTNIKKLKFITFPMFGVEFSL